MRSRLVLELAKPRSIGAITQKLSLLQTQLKALEEVVIPDTGTIWGDVDAIQNAALLTLSPGTNGLP